MKKSEYFSLSLRITHPDIDPFEISSVLGLSPNVSWKKGEKRSTPKGTLLEGYHKESYWCYSHPRKDTIVNLIDSINNIIVSNHVFLEKIANQGGRIEYFIGCTFSGHIGEFFPWTLLEKCAKMKINISLDIYTES